MKNQKISPQKIHLRTIQRSNLKNRVTTPRIIGGYGGLAPTYKNNPLVKRQYNVKDRKYKPGRIRRRK